jgi:predicted DNA binding protein
MLDVLIKVRPPSSWVTDVGSKHEIHIVIFNFAPIGKRGMKSLVEIRGEDEQALKEAAESLISHPDLKSFSMVSASSGRMFGSVIAKNWVAGSIILRSDCFLRQGKAIGDGWVEWELLVRDEATLADLKADLIGAGCDLQLVKKRRLIEPMALTDRQEIIVQAALDRGYYDFPRRISGAGLAKELGISRSTLSEILQRAERKMVDFYMKNRL